MAKHFPLQRLLSCAGRGLPGKIAGFAASRVFTPFQEMEPTRGIGCGKCAQLCPAKAISMKKGKLSVDRRICIHCFCCQKFCPKGAMKVGHTRIMRLPGENAKENGKEEKLI